MEFRGVIRDLNRARRVLQKEQAQEKGIYEFTDKIFAKGDLQDGFVRIRVYERNNWNTKPVIVTTKRVKAPDRKEFDTEADALRYVQEKYGGHVLIAMYMRTGEEWHVAGVNVFLEDIEHVGLSCEIVGKADECRRVLALLRVSKTQILPEAFLECRNT